MKKLFAVIMILAMLFTCCAYAEESALEDAKSYLYFMYKNKTETTMADYTVVANVVIDDVTYPIEWTADSDTIKFVYGDNGLVTVDVDEQNPQEVEYLLTATVKDDAGNAVSVSFKHRVPAALILDGMSYEQIVDAAYTLEQGAALEDTYRLFGTVTAINTAWSDQYKNITVTIQVGDMADKLIQCYRLCGEGCEALKEGDQITVEGKLKNYKGTIEFDSGCALIGMGEVKSQKAILDAAYALDEGGAMTAPTALEGEIVAIPTEWSDQYQNITVNIVVDGDSERPVQCYRLCGAGCEKLAVGDKIAVMGTIKNYKGTVEFDKACVLLPFGCADDVRTVLKAYTLEESAAMTEESTLTGVVSAIPTAWSEDYKNITVNIVIGGLTDYTVQCYRLSGEGCADLAVGDTVTVKGTIKNYKGTIEFDKGCVALDIIKAE